MNENKISSTITKLDRPEQSGDWHDKPLRWKVQTGNEVQKFATKKGAELYARIRRKATSDVEACHAFARVELSTF